MRSYAVICAVVFAVMFNAAAAADPVAKNTTAPAMGSMMANKTDVMQKAAAASAATAAKMETKAAGMEAKMDTKAAGMETKAAGMEANMESKAAGMDAGMDAETADLESMFEDVMEKNQTILANTTAQTAVQEAMTESSNSSAWHVATSAAFTTLLAGAAVLAL